MKWNFGFDKLDTRTLTILDKHNWRWFMWLYIITFQRIRSPTQNACVDYWIKIFNFHHMWPHHTIRKINIFEWHNLRQATKCSSTLKFYHGYYSQVVYIPYHLHKVEYVTCFLQVSINFVLLSLQGVLDFHD